MGPLGILLDFYKGRISKHTLQLFSESARILPLSIVFVLTSENQKQKYMIRDFWGRSSKIFGLWLPKYCIIDFKFEIYSKNRHRSQILRSAISGDLEASWGGLGDGWDGLGASWGTVRACRGGLGLPFPLPAAS